MALDSECSTPVDDGSTTGMDSVFERSVHFVGLRFGIRRPLVALPLVLSWLCNSSKRADPKMDIATGRTDVSEDACSREFRMELTQ